MRDDLDNTNLEDLIEDMEMGLVKSDKRVEFIESLKNTKLFLPIILDEDFFENIQNSNSDEAFTATEDMGFDINFLQLDEDKKAVALFTSSELMESTGLKSSAIAIYMSDLAEMLRKNPDSYSMISINPFTNISIDIPIDSFFNLFDDHSAYIESILGVLKEKSQELERDYAFFSRSKGNFMKENAVDGLFTSDIPFKVSSKEDFHQDGTYLDVLIMPKSSKILFVGGDSLDTVIAPESQFRIIEEIDEHTTVWQCMAQPFYDSDE